MARYNQKRKRSTPFKRTVKRKRTFKRRSRIKTATGDTNRLAIQPYKSRKLKRSSWKRALWNATITQTKYKSALVKTSSITTPASNTGITSGSFYLLEGPGGVTEPYWTAAGGMYSIDEGSGVPTFNGDLIIRGGQIMLEIYNNTETADVSNDSIYGKMAIIKVAHGLDVTYLNGLVPPRGAKLDKHADFRRRVGYVCAERDFIIKDGESASMSYRLPIHKTDRGAEGQIGANESTGKYVAYFMVGNGFLGVAQSCLVRMTHDISFCGDTIT